MKKVLEIIKNRLISTFTKDNLKNYFKSPVTRLKKGIIYSHIKWLNAVFRVMGYVDLLLLPLYAYLCVELVHRSTMNGVSALGNLQAFLFERFPSALFGVIIVYLIFLLLLLIFKKAFIAGLVFSVASALLCLANFFKFSMTGDYLYPWDVFNQTGNIGELASFLTIPLEWWVIVLISGFAVATAVLFFTKPDLPLKAFIRIPAAAVIAALMINSVSTPEKVQKLLNDHNLQLEDMALQESNYRENGFIGAFVINLLSSKITPPDNYSPELLEDILGGYEYRGEENFSSPDIVVVLAESFWDPRLLPGVEFSKNPLENYDKTVGLENTVSGRFFTTGFGGGTVRPEFELLTGLSTDSLPAGSVPWQYVTRRTESYVSLYHDLGYKTVAMHPYTSSFYLRKEAYPKIGFDELLFEDYYYNHPEIEWQYSGGHIADSTFAECIKDYVDKSDTPVFLFGISMENHQPYTDKYAWHDIKVTSTALEPSVLADLENYTQGIYHADKALGELVDWVDTRERDTVLVWFGDHLPTLGANYAAYTQSGMIELGERLTWQMKELMQSTPYLIYSNFELKENAMVSAGVGNDIASWNLLNALSDAIGAPSTPLMQFLKDYYTVFPYYNVRLYNTIFPNEIWDYTSKHATLTYDRTVGKAYSQ